MRKRTGPGWMKGLRVGLLIGVVLLFCVLAAAGVNGPDSVPVDAGSVKLRLFEGYDKWLVFLLESPEDPGELLAYQKDTSMQDEALVEAEVVGTGLAYFIDGEYLRVAEYVEEYGNTFVQTAAYSIDPAFEQDNNGRRMFDFIPGKGDKLFFAGSDVMYVLSTDGSLRVCYQAYYDMDEPEEDPVLTDVEFISIAPGGWVYAYSDGTLTRLDGSGGAVEYAGAPCPKRMVGESAYINTDDQLVRLADGAYWTVELPIDGLKTDVCFAAEEYVIAADSYGVLHKFDWSAGDLSPCGTAEVDGEILGIAGEYALTAGDSELCLVHLVFQEEEEPIPPLDPTPTPTPTPEPTSDPTPEPTETSEPSTDPSPVSTESPTPSVTEEPSSPEPSATSTPPPGGKDEVGEIIDRIQYKDLEVEGRKYIAVRAGAKVSEIRKIYEPQAIKAFTRDGGKVYESILKTGMKINIPIGDTGTEDVITVVVRGDCDGSGRVDNEDVHFASLFLLDAQHVETEEQFLSMDMNSDSKFTIWDMPPLARESKRHW